MLVDESRLCDLSVINGAVIPCWSTLTAEDRSQLALSSWAGHTVERHNPVVFKTESRLERVRPYLNRICSIGSYLCVLKLKGDRIPSLVDEPRLCDLSVIIGPVIPLLVSLRPQRIVLSLLWAAGKVTQLSDRLLRLLFLLFPFEFAGLFALQCCSKQILGDFRRQALQIELLNLPNMSFEFAMLPFLDEHTITGLTANKTTISICSKKLKMLTESINHPRPCFTHKSKPTNLRLLLQFKTTMRVKKYVSATSTVDSPFH
ncbi:hypothetical protein Goklo_013612 [Gossypium klotzschianum]|uniref:Uncharacterized protein n=1 Tax=Gossypium klotzschianum TaxID=34286 RepID=A0A7J8U513_9ROSI|nr:hypothetical protein [Gossypium klotzschianum]